MRAGQAKASFVDCAQHGAGAELFVVEGESAARSVAAVRSARHQAVLPLQGKPMNAWRVGSTPAARQAAAARVRSHALYQQFAQAMGMADATALASVAAEDEAAACAALRFERVVLLMDPDADGIHIGALMVLYVQRWAPALIRGGHLFMARAPMFVLTPSNPAAATQWAYTPDECQRLKAALVAAGAGEVQVQAVRGLGSLAPLLLSEQCVDPTTRRLSCVGDADVQAIVAVFGAHVD